MENESTGRLPVILPLHLFAQMLIFRFELALHFANFITIQKFARSNSFKVFSSIIEGSLPNSQLQFPALSGFRMDIL